MSSAAMEEMYVARRTRRLREAPPPLPGHWRSPLKEAQFLIELVVLHGPDKVTPMGVCSFPQILIGWTEGCVTCGVVPQQAR
jgi:hypothetical protein